MQRYRHSDIWINKQKQTFLLKNKLLVKHKNNDKVKNADGQKNQEKDLRNTGNTDMQINYKKDRTIIEQKDSWTGKYTSKYWNGQM
jgi:hypothetical protein